MPGDFRLDGWFAGILVYDLFGGRERGFDEKDIELMYFLFGRHFALPRSAGLHMLGILGLLPLGSYGFCHNSGG